MPHGTSGTLKRRDRPQLSLLLPGRLRLIPSRCPPTAVEAAPLGSPVRVPVTKEASPTTRTANVDDACNDLNLHSDGEAGIGVTGFGIMPRATLTVQ